MPVRRRSNPIAWTKLHPAGRLCRPSRGFFFVKGKKRMTNGNTDDKNYKIAGQAAKTAARRVSWAAAVQCAGWAVWCRRLYFSRVAAPPRR